MKIMILLLMMIIPQLEADTKYVRKIELNHVYNKISGNYVLSQILIRRWMVLSDSVGYRIVKFHVVDEEAVSVYPHKEGKIICFYDKHEVYHRYLTNDYLEYKSNYDVEVKDRELLHEDDRQE